MPRDHLLRAEPVIEHLEDGTRGEGDGEGEVDEKARAAVGERARAVGGSQARVRRLALAATSRTEWPKMSALRPKCSAMGSSSPPRVCRYAEPNTRPPTKVHSA